MTFREFRVAAMVLAAENGLGTVVCGVDQHGNADREDPPTWNLSVFSGQEIVASACFQASPEAALEECRRQLAGTAQGSGVDPVT